MARSDEELLEAARAGDDEALEALLARHEHKVFRFGLRMCGNEEDARDVLQETLLAVFKGLRQFRGEAQLSTWLYQVARSFCTKARRRGVGEPAQTEPLEGAAARAVSAPVSGPDDRAHAREMARVLQEALLALPESQREVVLLRDVEGLSAEEAAAVVGIEVPALKSRLHRARLVMQERIAALLGVEGGRPASCPELARELLTRQEDELDQAACARLEAHLSSCPRCGPACEELKRSVSLCRALPEGGVPVEVRARVRTALRDAVHG
ncbi:MAG: sigma-70 family RNA polymerase sigma factor [Myxococcaceae bacterium]|nr:MAG: sigma-70 family RNA polymerase sigma factor [Myxococcaceae bacterium]